MKNIILFIILTLSLNINAQNKRQQIEEKVKSLKIAFITNKLDLTPDESQKFWPVFNQLESERVALLTEKRADGNDFNNDKEAAAYISKHFEIREKELALEKKYIEKFKSVLPIQKVAKLIIIEKKFKQEVLSNILDKKKSKS
jgi:hypothetical protein